MRYIDIELIRSSISEEWMRKAQEACSEIRKLPPEKRAEAINKHSLIWRSLKDQLKELSHNKCWYCESSAHRIVGDVDHQRPKNEVKQCPEHYGYWWLAFEWKNYRYACELCNRRNKDHATGSTGGKGSYFPLLDPSKRIFDECDYDDLMSEDPLLLDPTVALDPPLITFDPDGSARSIYNEDECLADYQRAQASIEFYHLNHTDLKARRQLDICYRVSKLVKKIDRYFPRWQKDRSDEDAHLQTKEASDELKRMLHERAEYSAAAIAALKNYRTSKRKWIEPLLSA